MINTRAHVQDSHWVDKIQGWAKTLGFSQIGIADVDLSSAEPGLSAWLQAGFHGQMDYMARHGMKRARPAELLPGTVSVLTARMDYLSSHTAPGWQDVQWQALRSPEQAVLSLYAHGRDYHKVLRTRLQTLAQQMQDAMGPLGYRVFTDSAPVLETELASRSGLGWRGKHTLLINRQAGSMFFLGEVFINQRLPATTPASAHCGSCQACIDVCPTQAIVAPHRLDARRCISYLTIEHPGPIDLALRPLLGNHVYGCDDCQLACPWNKFAQPSVLADFNPREHAGPSPLLQWLTWDEAQFLRTTEGTAVRRIGHERWLRNLAVAAGNALRSTTLQGGLQIALQHALSAWLYHPSTLVREHVQWAMDAPNIRASGRLNTPSTVETVTRAAT